MGEDSSAAVNGRHRWGLRELWMNNEAISEPGERENRRRLDSRRSGQGVTTRSPTPVPNGLFRHRSDPPVTRDLYMHKRI